MIARFHHSGFVVKDLDKMVAFYRDILGLRVIREVDGRVPFDVDLVGVPGAQRMIVFVGKDVTHHQLELELYVQPPSPEGHVPHHATGATHVCFEVDNIEETCQELTSRGVQFITPPQTRQAPDGIRQICCALDPEGNRLEFLQFTPAS